MDFSRFFIDRPIFAAVLSILIFITGLIAIPLLPVSEYPDVVPPSVQVRAEYPGANPKVIAETVATPLEEAINGVENMMYMKSVAGSDGVLVTTVTFRPGTDPDQAQVQVQNRVAQAEARLPEDVRRLGITTQKQSPTLTLVVHLFSPNGKYDSLYMRNYATLKVKDELARLPGVGQIQIFGSGEYAMRVWLDPNKVAARGLTASDVVTAMQEQNVQVSAGQLGAEPLPQESDFLISINAQGRLHTEEEFGNIILKTAQDGSLMLELTKLKVANGQLEDALKEINEATHRYLFWTSDVSPIGFSWPLEIVQDLRRLISLDTISELGKASAMMLTSKETLLPLFAALLLVGFSISSRRHFTRFLERSSARVGKVTQDHFWLTLRTVFWSILVASPLPVLWMTLGYGLQSAWPFPLAVAIGDGVTATVPLLWVVMICATFARPNGLFIAHFGWPRSRVAKAMRYYLMSIGLIVPLIMALIMFDNLNDREFSASLGRLCFLLICGALAVVTLSLKHAGIPLYLDKEGNGDNMVNRLLWNLMLGAPLVAMLAAAVGYLATAQALLARLETSVAIWFLLLVVYHIIRRWMLIQRRRLAFDRARHRRAEILAQRARGEDEPVHVSSPEGSVETEVSEVDLDAISTQSLRLVRSLLMLIALLSVIVLWSEIHSAFGFLENISLWDVTSTVQGVESLEPITLGAVLIAILVLIITTQLVRNLPALLELAILQHLDLTPGTGYAITTITKYLLMLVGGLVGFSMIGIEWSKLQWLVAALGVGLGFGLQEIFANFISGLIILFEKPIRIGDTVTIRDLTGSVTRINTRATTISDWDRKEIIVPNKAFITEQFINWSLSDSVTRVVLTVPAPVDADTEEMTKILIAAAHRCSLVIDTPAPEAFLVDLQQGIQIFELRIFAAEMGHRMPLRHEMHQLILAGFREHGIDMPFPPFQMRLESIDGRQSSKTMTSAGKTSRRTAGSL